MSLLGGGTIGFGVSHWRENDTVGALGAIAIGVAMLAAGIMLLVEGGTVPVVEVGVGATLIGFGVATLWKTTLATRTKQPTSERDEDESNL